MAWFAYFALGTIIVLTGEYQWQLFGIREITSALFAVCLLYGTLDHISKPSPKLLWAIPGIATLEILIVSILGDACARYFGAVVYSGIIALSSMYLFQHARENQGQPSLFLLSFAILGIAIVFLIQPFDAVDPRFINYRLIAGTVFGILAGMFQLCIMMEESSRLESDLLSRLEDTHNFRMLGSAAGGVAHDFNNQLTGILIHTKKLIKSTDQSDPNLSSLKAIQMSAERCAELADNLLALSRKKDGDAKYSSLFQSTVDVLRIVKPLLPKEMMFRSSKLSLLEPYDVNAFDLNRVLYNLLENAREAMGDKGDLRLNVDITKETSINDTDQYYADIKITDTGPGLDNAALQQIFDPLFSTKEKGTGLGLSICADLVEKNSGTISAKSTVGRGTTFRVKWPVYQRRRSHTGFVI